MFIQTNEQSILNLNNVKSIYVENINDHLCVIHADDFDGHSTVIYTGKDEEDTDNHFWKIVEEIKSDKTLINSHS